MEVVCVKIELGGLQAAKAIREEWSGVLADLIVETRPGQLSELYRWTERMFINWEETLVPGCKARQPSLYEAIMQSKSELESRFSRRKQREFGESTAKTRTRRRERASKPPKAREGSRTSVNRPIRQGEESAKERDETARNSPRHLPETGLPGSQGGQVATVRGGS